MGTGPIENSDNNISIGNYWIEQANKEERTDTPWKGPDGSNNVPVGKTETEINKPQSKTTKNSERISWKDTPNVIKNLPSVLLKMVADQNGIMHPDKKINYYSISDIIKDLKK